MPLERRNVDDLHDRRRLPLALDDPWNETYGTTYVLSGDGRRMCSRDNDGDLQTWDVATFRRRVKWSPGPHLVMWVSLNHDGSRLLTGQDEDIGRESPWTVRLWDTASGEMLVEFENSSDHAASARFSPNGAIALMHRREASDTDVSHVTLWATHTGRALRKLTMPGGVVHSAAFSGDGARVAVAGDRDVRLYDAATGNEVARLDPGFSGRPHIAWSADGTTMVLGSPKGIIDVWRPIAIGAVLAANAE